MSHWTDKMQENERGSSCFKENKDIALFPKKQVISAGIATEESPIFPYNIHLSLTNWWSKPVLS